MTKVTTLHFLSVFLRIIYFFATMVSNLRAKVCYKYLEEDWTVWNSFFILSLISNQHYAKIEQQRQSREVAENERTLEELKKLSPLELAQIEFEPIIKEALRNNRDVKFPEIKVIWNKYGSSFKVEVDCVISGSLTSVVDSFTLISAARLLAKEMAERPSLAIIDELKLNGKIVGLNKYGNQSFAQGAIVTLQPSEIKKINWANMDHTNFRLFLEAS